MFKIAICEDEPVMLNRIKNMTTDVLNAKNITFQIDTFLSGELLWEKLESGDLYNLALLDIELEQLDGIELGSRIYKKFSEKKTTLIYVSSYDYRAKETMHFKSHRFLSKPLEYQLLEEALTSAYAVFEYNRKKRFTFKEFNSDYITLNVSDIRHFSIYSGRKIKVVAADKEYLFKGKLNDVEKELDSPRFLRIHKSFLVNYSYIKKYSYESIVMEDDVTFDISGPKRSVIRKEYLNLRERGE